MLLASSRAVNIALRIYSLTYLSLTTSLIAMMASSFAVGAFTVYGTQLGHESLGKEINRVPVFVVGLPVVVPVSLTVANFFAILLSLYLLLFILAVLGPNKSLLSVIREVPRFGPSGAKGNSIYSVATLFATLIVVITIIQFFQERAGVRTGSLPEFDPVLMFLFISHAPLVEEIGFRVTIVGLAALWFLVGRRLGWKVVFVLWSPAKYLRVFLEEGYERALRYAMITVVISALFFGAAHFLYGAGWEVGKVSTSFLAGLGLGWLYLEYGFPAAVLLHWSFNYFGSAFFYYSKAIGQAIFDPVIDFLLVSVGVLSLVSYGISLYRKAFPGAKLPSL